MTSHTTLDTPTIATAAQNANQALVAAQADPNPVTLTGLADALRALTETIQWLSWSGFQAESTRAYAKQNADAAVRTAEADGRYHVEHDGHGLRFALDAAATAVRFALVTRQVEKLADLLWSVSYASGAVASVTASLTVETKGERAA